MSPRVTRRAVLMGAATLAVATPSFADDAVDGLLARIAAARGSLRSLKGPFVQTRTIGLMATDVRSTGTMTLQRPDRLRWELAPPDSITFWFGPEGLAYRDAHGQARLPPSSSKLAGVMGDLRTLLGGDPAKLRERWDLRVVRDDATGAELAATPKVATPGLASLGFALGPDLIRPTRTTLVEGPRAFEMIVTLSEKK